MSQLLAIAAGGSLGAVLRFLISERVYEVWGRDFPYGTVAVNVLGSFFIGALFYLFNEKWLVSTEVKAVVMIGFLGAMTTFSTFSLDTVLLIEKGEVLRAFGNVLLSVSLCVLVTWLTLKIAKTI